MSSLWRKIVHRVTADRNKSSETSTRSNGRDSPAVVERTGYTYNPVTQFYFTWTIQNFSFCHERTGRALKSPEFSIGTNNDGPKWFLLVYPNGLDEECRDHVGLFLLAQMDDPQTILKVKYSLSLLKGGKKLRSRPRIEQIFERNSNSWGFRKFIEREVLLDEKNGLLPNDDLTIFCEIKTSLDRRSHIVVDDDQLDADAALQTLDDDAAAEPNIRLPECDLSDDMRRLLDYPPGMCDVMLVAAGGEVTYAHKVVLTARSPVFAAMFEHEMVERKWNRVNIADIEPAVLKSMLEYVYTGEEPARLKEMAEGLLAAADKYDLGRLRVMCERVLVEKICVGQVADILILADLHNAEHLKRRAMNFVKKSARSTDLLATESWKNLVSEYPHLADEALK